MLAVTLLAAVPAYANPCVRQCKDRARACKMRCAGEAPDRASAHDCKSQCRAQEYDCRAQCA